MVLLLTTVYDAAAIPPKLTDVAPMKLLPVMVTVKPLPDEVGVNVVIKGGPTTKIQAAPVYELSLGPPNIAVFPFAEMHTDEP
jgi:hypothetical protein